MVGCSVSENLPARESARAPGPQKGQAGRSAGGFRGNPSPPVAIESVNNREPEEIDGAFTHTLITTAFAVAVLAAAGALACSADRSASLDEGVVLAQATTPSERSGLPADVGRTGGAPHTETGAGTDASKAVPSPQGSSNPNPTSGSWSDPSGKRPGGATTGATEQGNTEAREQRMGEHPSGGGGGGGQ